MHSVDITDDNDNWSLWGELVNGWIANPTARPTNVGELRAAMLAAGVAGTVQGAASRIVNFVDYIDDTQQPFVIPLPTAAAVLADEQLLDNISTKPVGQRRYPLPTFYAVVFGGSAMVDLTTPQLLAMGRRRLGEYVINECM